MKYICQTFGKNSKAVFRNAPVQKIMTARLKFLNLYQIHFFP